MTPALLAEIGRALYGPRWQSEMARELDVSVRTIVRWAGGKWPVPEGVPVELRTQLELRGMDIRDLLGRLPKAA